MSYTYVDVKADPTALRAIMNKINETFSFIDEGTGSTSVSDVTLLMHVDNIENGVRIVLRADGTWFVKVPFLTGGEA
jgi:hypothetical protein